MRWEAPLAEVAALREGAIIDLGQRIDEQSVTVWVEQRCIGKGQLVAVGERLGVRLLSIPAQTP
jgi:type III secretion protein Q